MFGYQLIVTLTEFWKNFTECVVPYIENDWWNWVRHWLKMKPTPYTDWQNMSSLMTKPTKWLRPTKTQISLGIRSAWSGCQGWSEISLGIRLIWSESSLCAQWVGQDLRFLHADSKDSDQTGGCPGRSESSLGAHSLCWFCHAAAHIASFPMS